MPTTERRFDDELHEELRRVVGPGWLACDREVMLTLLADLRERIAVYAERKDGYLAESIRKLDLLAPEGRPS